MLDTIKRFFETHLTPGDGADERDPVHAQRLAAAALLLELADSDYQRRPEERETVLRAVRDNFGLGADEARQLIELAERERADATDYFQFTALINRTYDPEQKIELVETLWKVAFADEHIHKYEEHLVRRLADLLHVPHADFIAAKHRVVAGRGSGT